MVDRRRVLVAPRRDSPPRVVPDKPHAIRIGCGNVEVERADGREVCRAVGDLDAQHESHPVEESGQPRPRTRVEQEPGDHSVIEHASREFDAAARVEKKGLG